MANSDNLNDSSELDPQPHRYSLRKRRLPANRAEIAEMEYMGLDETETVASQSVKRRRKKSPAFSRAEKEKNKFLRNSGKEYTGRTGKTVKNRVCRPAHTCKRLKCHEIITEDVGMSLFSEYWEQESHDKRVAYVAARIISSQIKQHRPRLSAYDPKSHSKHVSWQYYFDIHGERKRVCKDTFLGTLGETDCFLRTVVQNKLKSTSGITHRDNRGRAPPKHKLPESTKTGIISHIVSVPSYVSHYCRAQSDARYLPSHLNIKTLYEDYLSKEGNPKVSYSTYQKFFNTTGRKFKKPHSDTCKKCDEWSIQLEMMPLGEERNDVERAYNEHLERAEAGYNKLREERTMATQDDSRRLLVFDLQQCLETPYIKTSSAFYARQLYTYNLTITAMPSRKAFCYMWHEGESGRGANEISSCLFAHILQLPTNIRHLTLASDSCSGQNRNSIAMLHTVLQIHPTLLSVEHFFLETGHTRLDCDSKHAQIEKAKATASKISVPEDWYNLIRGISNVSAEFPEGSFEVVLMSGNFYNFAQMLKGPLVLRQKDQNKNPFNWLKAHVFQYYVDKPGLTFVKNSFNDQEEEICLNMRPIVRKRAGQYTNLSSYLTAQSRSTHPISVEKKSDLLGLLPLIEAKYHPFYHALQTSATLDDIDPDIVENEEDVIRCLQTAEEED